MSALRWMMPAGSAPADTFTLYRDGRPVLPGILARPDAGGIYTTQLPGWPTSAVYTLTASNSAGESEQSNPLPLPEPSVGGGLAVSVLALLLLHRVRRWGVRVRRLPTDARRRTRCCDGPIDDGRERV